MFIPSHELFAAGYTLNILLFLGLFRCASCKCLIPVPLTSCLATGDMTASKVAETDEPKIGAPRICET